MSRSPDTARPRNMIVQAWAGWALVAAVALVVAVALQPDAARAVVASDEPVDEVESLDVPHRLRGRRAAVLTAESP